MTLVSIPANPVPEDVVSGTIKTPDGAELRFARWAPPAGRKGTVCVFTGRGEYIEKYFETVRDLRDRGFAVAMIDWRGQGHFRALTEEQEVWAVSHGFDEVIVKTKNRYYDMRGTLDNLQFDVVKLDEDDQAWVLGCWKALGYDQGKAKEEAAKDVSADVIDLRTLMPWDREMVLESVHRTRRCLIVHEDLRTGGFGAEIAAVVVDEAFLDLDAPVARVTMPDIPSPHNPVLMDWVVPSVAKIRAKIDELVGF